MPHVSVGASCVCPVFGEHRVGARHTTGVLCTIGLCADVRPPQAVHNGWAPLHCRRPPAVERRCGWSMTAFFGYFRRLRWKLTASYMLVTVAALVAVELLLLGMEV